MACRDCENREISKRQDPEGWRDMEMGPVECEKHRSATMASEDVLERAESWLGSFCQGLTHKLERTDRLVSALSAEVRELRKDRALLAEVVQAPFPLHDYCSEEAWRRACEIVAAIGGED